MPYKENCGFKKIDVCGFKEEDCTPEECDMFDIEFGSKSVLKTSKELRKRIVNYQNQLVKMKRKGEHKTKREEYQKIKKLRNDCVHGMLKMSKAYTYTKRIGK